MNPEVTTPPHQVRGLRLRRFGKRLVQSHDTKHQFFLRLSKATRALDLGCGDGTICTTLKALYPSLTLDGVDIANGNVPAFVQYQSVDLDLGRLPFPDAVFDAIIFNHVIEHLRYPQRLGPEIRRTLKPGGLIYIETPNWTSILVPSFGFRRDQLNPFNFYDDHTHVRPWTKLALFGFLTQDCGLRVERVGTRRNWLRVPLDLIAIPFGLITGDRLLINGSFWNLYGWCIYGVGIKV